MSDEICEREWEWGIEFSAMCSLPRGHSGTHFAEIPDGSSYDYWRTGRARVEAIPAVVTWRDDR